MSKKNNTTQNSNTATKNTTNRKENTTMKKNVTITNVTLENDTYTVTYSSGTIRKYPINKAPKTVLAWLEKHTTTETEVANVETPAPEQVVEEPVVEKTIDNTEEKIKTILEETADVDKEENTMKNVITINPTTITPMVMDTESWMSKHYNPKEEDMNMNSNPSTITTMPVISDIMDGEYRPVDIAEKIYTAIWECLPDRGRTLMDGLTILTLGTVYAVEDFVDFARERVAPVVITLAKDTAEGITNWWRAEGKPFAEDMIDEVSADAEAFAETILIPTAKKVGRGIINGAKRFARSLKKGWAMRSDLINEYKEVA